MSNRHLLPFLLLLVLTLIPGCGRNDSAGDSLHPGNPASTAGVSHREQNPQSVAGGPRAFSFLPNVGQWDRRALYRLDHQGMRLWFAADETVIELDGHILRHRFLGAGHYNVRGAGEQDGGWNFLHANSSRRNVHGFDELRFEEIYPGISGRYYRNGSALKYELEVAAGADPAKVRFRYDGADDISITDDGRLRIETSVGDLLEEAPYVYQTIDGVETSVPASFTIDEDGGIGFDIGDYDTRRPLTIDPVLIYSSYIGGSGNETGEGIALDPAGRIYVTGTTLSTDFPTTAGAFKRTLDERNRSMDIFVTCFDPTGSVLVYGTYIGGSGIDRPAGIIARGNGSVTVAGTTSSPDFPGAWPANQLRGATDGFVATLDPTGAALRWSRYLGGSAADTIEAIAKHPVDGDAVVVGATTSQDFPVTPGAHETSPKGLQDAFATRLDSATGDTVHSTYLGGGSDDHATAVVVEAGGAVYLTGWTRSTDLVPAGSIDALPYSTVHSGGIDGFITRIRNDFTRLDYQTFVGGSGNDTPMAIAIDSGQAGKLPSAFITGTTTSADFPDSMSSGPGEWFLTRVPLSTGILPYSRFIAASGAGRSIQVSEPGEAFLAGTATTRNTDIALVRVSADGRTILRNQTIGGSGSDIPSRQSVLTRTGDLFLTGTTFSADFPTRRGAFDTTLNQTGNPGPSDAILLRYNFDPTRVAFAFPRRTITPLACDTIRRDTFHVYNVGDADLSIEELKFVGAPSPRLLVEPTLSELPRTIKGGDSLRVIITFSSTTTTVTQDTLLVFSNDPRLNPLRIAITAARSAPGIVAVPSAVTFPRMLECAAPRDLPVVIRNSGKGPVTLVTPVFTGGSGAFTLVPNGNFPVTLPEGQAKALTVRFTPRGPGKFQDTLLVRTNECNAPMRIPVEGIVDSVRLRFAETELRLPALSACAAGLDTFVTVINAGSVPVNSFTALASSPQFTITGALPAELLPGERATIDIRYTPTSGSVAASLKIDASPCSVSASIDLFASHRERQTLDVDTRLLDFGMLQGCRGQALESTLRVRLSNRGGVEIGFGDEILPAPFVFAGSFPASLAPGGTAVVDVIYRPVVRGGDTVELQIPYSVDGCLDTARIVLQGFREEPLLEPERTILEFAPLGACEARALMPLVLFNRSSITSSVVGTRSTSGVSVFRPTIPFEIPPGESDTIWVRFEPRRSGQSEEELTLLTEPCGDSIPLLIRGTKTGGVTTLDEAALDFPPMLSCASDVDSFVVLRYSDGAGSVSVSSAVVVGAGGAIVAGPGSGRQLGTGDTLRIPVRFSPAAGSGRGELQLVLEPCGDTLRIPLSAESLTPALTIEGGNFGLVPVRGSSRERVVVRNPLSIPLTIERLDNLPPPFRVVATTRDLPATIAPGDSVVFEIEFSPLISGSYSPTAQFVASGGCEFGVNIQLTAEGGSADRLGFCISGDIRGGVGDTITVSVRADSIYTFASAGTIHYAIPYDPDRLLLTEVRSDGPLVVLDSGYPGGVLRVRRDGAGGVAAVPLVLRFLLLAGAESTTDIRLDTVRVEGVDGLVPAVCMAEAVIEITDDCLVGGLVRGKYANRLEEVSPNPAGGIVEITYQQLESARAILRIFDAGGREVMRPLDRWLAGGRYTVRVDLSELAAGGYFYVIEVGEYREGKRVVVGR